MAQTMKIRKGDTVQVLHGQGPGKRGRVLEARPKRAAASSSRTST